MTYFEKFYFRVLHTSELKYFSNSLYAQSDQKISSFTQNLLKTSKYANFDKPRTKLNRATTWPKVNPCVWVNYSHKKNRFFIPFLVEDV